MIVTLVIVMIGTILFSFGNPSTASEETDRQYERIKIVGETSNKGVFDPSVEYNKDGSVGYLVYSGLEQPPEDINNPYPKYIHTHLAKSIDGGETWIFVKRITESREGVKAGTASLRSIGFNDTSYEGVWHHEVPTLLYDPDDHGKEWKLFWMKYYSILNPANIQRIRVPEYMWIMYKSADSPEKLDEATEIRLLGTSLATPGAEHDLGKIISGFRDFTFYAEPGSLYKDGVLYVSLSGANHNNAEGHRIFLLASRDYGETWDYLGILTVKKDARRLGYVLFTASSLAEEKGKVFLLVTPAKLINNQGTHLGTYIFEFEDIVKAKLKRDDNGNLIVHKYLKRKLPGMFNSGQSTYHEHNTYGGIIMPQGDPYSAPVIGQIFSTKEKIAPAIAE